MYLHMYICIFYIYIYTYIYYVYTILHISYIYIYIYTAVIPLGFLVTTAVLSYNNTAVVYTADDARKNLDMCCCHFRFLTQVSAAVGSGLGVRQK